MARRRPPRLADSEYVGAARIFLTMCTFDRRRYFTSRVSIDTVLQQLLRTASVCAVEIVAYCFMPDHVHALVAGTSEGSNLHQFFQRFRQQSGFHHQSCHRPATVARRLLRSLPEEGRRHVRRRQLHPRESGSGRLMRDGSRVTSSADQVAIRSTRSRRTRSGGRSSADARLKPSRSRAQSQTLG